jgi:hypothetical protein
MLRRIESRIPVFSVVKYTKAENIKKKLKRKEGMIKTKNPPKLRKLTIICRTKSGRMNLNEFLNNSPNGVLSVLCLIDKIVPI